MNLLNLFKKKSKPINPGDYNWDFQYVKGGFCELKNLHTKVKPKKWFVFMWMGGFKFKWYWATPIIDRPKSKPEKVPSYEMKLNFNSEFYDLQDHNPFKEERPDNLK